MDIVGTSRRSILPLAIGLIVLSMAVFGWGLQYKVSLYPGHEAAAHEIPAAKLLSQKERAIHSETTAAPAPVSVPTPQQVVFFLVSALALCFLPEVDARYRQRNRERSWPIPSQICLRAVFFRPPPCFA